MAIAPLCRSPCPRNSGALNSKGRNNTSGGVLLEQGTQEIRGNGVWTHSCYQSARNLRGRIANNKFSDIGRHAIQIGHASEITVTGNIGARIGMKVPERLTLRTAALRWGSTRLAM